MYGRYAKRRDPDGNWEVYEIDTGEVMMDAPLADLDEHEADEYLEILNNPESFYTTDQAYETQTSRITSRNQRGSTFGGRPTKRHHEV